MLVDFLPLFIFVPGNCDVTDKKCSACRYKFIGSLLPPPSAFYEKISQEDAQSPNGTTKVTVAEKSGETKVPGAEKVKEKKHKEDPKVRKFASLLLSVKD